MQFARVPPIVCRHTHTLIIQYIDLTTPPPYLVHLYGLQRNEKKTRSSVDYTSQVFIDDDCHVTYTHWWLALLLIDLCPNLWGLHTHIVKCVFVYVLTYNDRFTCSINDKTAKPVGNNLRNFRCQWTWMDVHKYDLLARHSLHNNDWG